MIALYDALLPNLRLQRFLNAYAGVALPNPGSVRLHEAIGMRPVATYERVGWKQGAWLDVMWLHMPLATAFPNPPPEPIALPDLMADPRAAARVHAIRKPDGCYAASAALLVANARSKICSIGRLRSSCERASTPHGPR